jgi:hypothetical protein
MINLYIRLENGEPVGHPIAGSNLQYIFPGINLENNIPEGCAKFQRNDVPELGVYEKLEGTTYEFIDGVVHDVHNISKLTKTEMKKMQEDTKERWKSNPLAFKSWKFNPKNCCFEAPIPYPTDGKLYEWDELTVNWKIYDPASVIPLTIVNNEIVTEMIENGTLPTEIEPTIVNEPVDEVSVDDTVVTDTPAAE